MSTLNYSKWDHIEVSDDEDDTHPNIDTPSLFRWRHQARIDRDAAWKKEKEEFETNYTKFLNEESTCKRKLEKAKEENDNASLKELEEKMEKLKAEAEEWLVKERAIKKKERLRPLNIDTICKEGKSKTVINTAKLDYEKSVSESENSEEATVNRLKDFADKHGKAVKKFGMYRRPMDSQQYLIENPYLVCDDTANELVLWCIDLAMEEKIELMNHVSHQCILMQFMLELAKSLKCDPRSCIRPFFAKFVNPEPEYERVFNEELTAFRDRIKARAKVRLEEAMTQIEEEERQKRLGPGGLDPVEVFESLPKNLQECFEGKDVDLLKNVLSSMDIKDAEYYMKRCVDSGLWVNNANMDDLNPDDAEAGEEQQTQEPTESNTCTPTDE